MITERSAGWWDQVEARGHTRTAVVEALTELLLEGEDWLPAGFWDRVRELDRKSYSRRDRGSAPAGE